MICGSFLSSLCLLFGIAAGSAEEKAPDNLIQQPGHAVEKHMPGDLELTQFVHNPELLAESTGDELALVEVPLASANTVKLRGVVPPVRFESGVAQIPASTVRELQVVMDGLRDRHNVRLHLVGHADNQPLSATLARIYGDNAGLSKERAGEVAEFFYDALQLGPQSISYEWAGDTQPVATNATADGRSQNRRVEVEVWYDELAHESGTQEVVIANDTKRVKVCRVQTLCKMRYLDGHDKRARVQNVIAPLQYDNDSLQVDAAFVERVKRAWLNLADRGNVVMKFIGHTDTSALDERNARIYGDHNGLSKARAWRVALAVREQLGLASDAIDADGMGADAPLASNNTSSGQALNRRVEVEFWYDDPLQELPDEPQFCPGEQIAITQTHVYTPSWGELPQMQWTDNALRMPRGLADQLSRAMAEAADRDNLRIRVIGYTANETLDRRTAAVYGDDVGLSTARARAAAQAIASELGLANSQVEFEGRGFVHADDVVNAGFIQGENSHLVAQVIFDEQVLPDDLAGTEINPLRQELAPENPFALNLMRITVDGVPIDDKGRSSADVQRCTDVALQSADISFAFDNLRDERRLSVDAEPARVVVDAQQGTLADPLVFRMHANYNYFIDRAEIRIFPTEASTQSTPLAVLPVDELGSARWQPEPGELSLQAGTLQYLLRAYGEDGNFDETLPRRLELLSAAPVAALTQAELPDDQPLLAGYGLDGLAMSNIRLGSGTVQVSGSDIPAGHQVWVAGQPVPVDADGNFVSEQILPEGMHTVEVAVLDAEGNGELFLRDLEFAEKDWFYVGMADFTFSSNSTDGPAELLQGENSSSGLDEDLHGRIAFYANGKFGDRWRLTSSLDTKDEPVDQMFSNFIDKTPEALFRRIDPDYHYPTYGDDSTVEEMAPTSGKMYVKVSRGDSHAMWGNVGIRYDDNELAQVDRGIYGANVLYQSEQTTSFGERRFAIDGFAAEPGTVPTRQEFRGTGGSLYFLQHQDILSGSERLRIETRDPISGLATGATELRPGLDYTVDYLQGTVLLSEPLAATAFNHSLVRDGAFSGDEAYLVVRYEYTPGFDEIDAISTGAQGHMWITDTIQVGMTSNMNELDDTDSNLHAANLTYRKSAETWLKLQTARTEGALVSTMHSDDGGFGFSGFDAASFDGVDAGAHRLDASVSFDEFGDWARGKATFYAQHMDAGYAAPGQMAMTDTDHYGLTLAMPVTDTIDIHARSESREADLGVSHDVYEFDGTYQLSERWEVRAGMRQDSREDNSALVPLTQDVGDRTDLIVQVGFDPDTAWDAYVFGQGTVSKDETRDSNNRFGIGGSYAVTDKMHLDGEISGGDLGMGGKVGTRYALNRQTSMYLNYALENERTDNLLLAQRGREGNLVGGVKTRLSDSTSVYSEHRYRSGQALTGLTHATGVNLTPTPRWNFGVSTDFGTLRDRLTGAETERQAMGVNASYKLGEVNLSAGVEYRNDEAEQPDLQTTTRDTYLFRSSFKWQSTPSTRLLGKFNHATSDSSLGEFYDGGYTEASVGFAYRPIHNDRLNALVKYTYLFDVPTTDQLTLRNVPVQYIQKSHVASVDVTYDLSARWSIGGKYAHRLGAIALDREDQDFFDNNASLYVLRTDYRLFEKWEILAEARQLDMSDLGDSRSGALVALSRYVGEHFKIGVGYNFTDFSDDLTDLSFEHRGAFLNLTGVL